MKRVLIQDVSPPKNCKLQSVNIKRPTNPLVQQPLQNYALVDKSMASGCKTSAMFLAVLISFDLFKAAASVEQNLVSIGTIDLSGQTIRDDSQSNAVDAKGASPKDQQGPPQKTSPLPRPLPLLTLRECWPQNTRPTPGS